MLQSAQRHWGGRAASQEHPATPAPCAAMGMVLEHTLLDAPRRAPSRCRSAGAPPPMGLPALCAPVAPATGMPGSCVLGLQKGTRWAGQGQGRSVPWPGCLFTQGDEGATREGMAGLRARHPLQARHAGHQRRLLPARKAREQCDPGARVNAWRRNTQGERARRGRRGDGLPAPAWRTVPW